MSALHWLRHCPSVPHTSPGVQSLLNWQIFFWGGWKVLPSVALMQRAPLLQSTDCSHSATQKLSAQISGVLQSLLRTQLGVAGGVAGLELPHPGIWKPTATEATTKKTQRTKFRMEFPQPLIK